VINMEFYRQNPIKSKRIFRQKLKTLVFTLKKTPVNRYKSYCLKNWQWAIASSKYDFLKEKHNNINHRFPRNWKARDFAKFAPKNSKYACAFWVERIR